MAVGRVTTPATTCADAVWDKNTRQATESTGAPGKRMGIKRTSFGMRPLEKVWELCCRGRSRFQWLDVIRSVHLAVGVECDAARPLVLLFLVCLPGSHGVVAPLV